MNQISYFVFEKRRWPRQEFTSCSLHSGCVQLDFVTIRSHNIHLHMNGERKSATASGALQSKDKSKSALSLLMIEGDVIM
jgi:hypothetical protein